MSTVKAYFSRFTESGKSAIVLYPSGSSGFGLDTHRVPVYADKQAVLNFNQLAELTEKQEIRLPSGLELIPMVNSDGELLTTKDGKQRMTFK